MFTHNHEKGRGKLDPRVGKCILWDLHQIRKVINVINQFPKNCLLPWVYHFLKINRFFQIDLPKNDISPTTSQNFHIKNHENFKILKTSSREFNLKKSDQPFEKSNPT